MTTKFFISTQLCTLLAMSTALAQAVDSTATENILLNVVITGQYAPKNAEDAVQRIRVIDSKKIAAMGAQNLRDVLLNEMNVSVAQDPALGSSVSIQGITGQNVKILIDGVPVIGRQAGDIDISQLNVYNVERVELVEGPMSVNYGTDALAGTINIITKSSVKGKVEGGANVYTETIGKYNVNANVGFNKNRSTFLVGGARNFFSGWDPGQGFSYLDFTSKFADSSRSLLWDTKEEYNANAQYSYRFDNITIRLKSDYFQDQITNRGKPDTVYGYSASDDVYKTLRVNNAVFANGKIFRNNKFSFLVAYNFYKREKNTFARDLRTLESDLGSALDQDTARYSLFNSRGTYSGGKHNSKINYELGYDINLDQGAGKRILNKEQQMGDYAAYGSAELALVSGLTARVGLRYAYNTAFRAPFIPSLNLKYVAGKELTFRASYARGFRAPGIKELYFEFKDSNHDIVGNPNLKPEESNNLNASANFVTTKNAVRYKIDASGFYNSITQMINLAQPNNSIQQYTYVNIDKFKTHGIQLNLTTEYKGFTGSLGGSYIGRFSQVLMVDKSATPEYVYTPEMRCNLSYEWTKYNTTFSVFGKYTGSMPSYGVDSSGNVLFTPVQAYTMADASLTKKVFKTKMAITLGCKNLFNTVNINRSLGAAGASAGATHSASSNSVSVSTGRSFFLALGYRFAK